MLVGDFIGPLLAGNVTLSDDDNLRVLRKHLILG
jgi:hypothetical protein